MGMGARSLRLLALAALGACKPDAPAPVANAVEPANIAAASPAPAAPAPGSPLGAWLVGSWSFDTSCATDFIVHYNADGTLQNGEDGGRWALAGDKVTETITERFEMGSDAPQKIAPPETRSYTVAQVDAGHGTLTYRGKEIPIQRC